MPTPADPRAYLREVALALDAAAPRGRGAIAAQAAAQLGMSKASLYRQLKRQIGWESQRKTRVDKGTTAVSEDVLVTLGAMQRLGVRQNGKQTLFVPTAADIAAASGLDIPVSDGRIAQLLRDRRLDVRSQRQAQPVQPLSAPHPNHTHEVDPSLCLVYYLGGKQFVVRDDQLYKNKLDHLAKVAWKCWRYVCYDRASGVIQVRYYEAAGETQANLFDFLCWAWGRKPEMTPHGVPLNILWDKGSANSAHGIEAVCQAVEVNLLTHAAGAPRVKGGVECANNIVETHFEARLRFEPVSSVQELNAAVWAWAEAYNANTLGREDSRIRREGIAPIARYDLWQRISAEQLRELPPVEVMRGLMRGREETRQVRRDLTVTYRHPAAQRSAAYSVAGLAGVCAGDEVKVRPLVFGECAIHIELARYDGAPLVYRLEPARRYDEYGNVVGAPEIGKEWHAPQHTEIERAAAGMDQRAWPDADDATAIRRARERGAVPFAGEMKAVSSLHDLERLDYLPKAGAPIPVRAPVVAIFEAAPLSALDAAKRLRALGVDRADLFDWLCAHYADGVDEAELESVARRAGRAGSAGLHAVEAGA